MKITLFNFLQYHPCIMHYFRFGFKNMFQLHYYEVHELSKKILKNCLKFNFAKINSNELIKKTFKCMDSI